MKTIRNIQNVFILSGLCLSLITGIITTPLTHAQTSDKELFLVAQNAFEDGFYDVAIRYIDQLFEQFPSTDQRIQANLVLGQCYFFKSQYLKAYDIFQKNLKYPENKDATLFWLGETHLKGADYKQAQDYFQQLLDLFPRSEYVPQAYYSLGWLYFEKGDNATARNFFSKLIKNYATHQLSEDAHFKLAETEHNLKEYEKAIERFQKYLINYPNSNRQSQAYFYIAESNYYLQNYLTAISYYAKTAEFSYDSNLILMSKVSMGWGYLKLEKFTLSQNNFESALSYAQDKGILSDDVYLGLANLYTQTNQLDKALNAYNQILKIFSNSQRIAESYLGKANIQYKKEDYASAILTYQTLLDEFSDQEGHQDMIEKAFFGLAWSYLKSNSIDLAVATFSKVKDRSTNDTVKISAMTQIGDAYQDAEEYQKAISIYDEILTGYPDSAYTDYVQYRQGVALLKMGEIDAAMMSFQSLAANFPNSRYNQDKNYYLAVAYFKKGDWISAKHQIRAFIDLQPKDSPFLAESHYILALSHFYLKNHQEAITAFQSMIRNFPDQTSMVHNAEINIAKSYYKMNNSNEALKRFRMIVNKYPKSEIAEEALIWLGDHYLRVPDLANAIVYYKQFIDEFPGSRQINIVRLQLGQSQEAQSNFEEAIKTYKQIDETADKIIFAKARLAIADIFSHELDEESAIETYQNIMITSPEFKRDALLKIADVHKKVKRYDDALQSYKKALETNQDLSDVNNAELLFLIADMLQLQNLPQQAIEEYFKIPYLHPKEILWVTKSYLRIARIFEDQDQWEQATNVYKKILTLKTEEAKFAKERLEWIEENITEF